MLQQIIRVAVAVGIVVGLASSARAQARVTIVNDSGRQMTVKVMESLQDAAALHSSVRIGAGQSVTVPIYQTGVYFLKTMAELAGADPIFQKGQHFRVYVGTDGYDVITMTFSIVESAIPIGSGGQKITRREYDDDHSRR